jgi:hypothetical protein
MSRRPVVLVLLTSAALLGVAGLVRRFGAVHPGPPPAAPVQPLQALDTPVAPQRPGLELRPVVAEALGHVPGIGWERRLALIRDLPGDPSPDEACALLAELTASCPAGVPAAVHSSYIHEIACILQHVAAVREGFARALASLARNLHRDASARDYAVQHLRQVWERARDNPALRASIVATFRELAGLDPAVSAPALLSLHLLGSPAGEDSRHRPPGTMARPSPPPATSGWSLALPDSEIVPLLAPVFAGQTTLDNIAARLTAARIAGERRLAGFRPALLAEVTDHSEHSLVRMAAANALGRIAHPDDLAALAAHDPRDDRVATALRHALGR